MQSIDEALSKLGKSKFRSGFHLNSDDIAYIDKTGLDEIRKHAEEFVKTRLAPANPVNDGKQTPWKGHPVFKAMHATACCCRGCLNKWYKVPKDRELSPVQQQKIVNLIMAWTENEIENNQSD